MNRQQRTKLHFGPYTTPRFKYGAVVTDEKRGDVKIVGLTDARIPWPIGKKGRAKSLILYRALAKAVRFESAAAVCHWWGVSIWKVNDWRKALGVPQNNPGTLKLRRLNGHSEYARRGLRLSWAKARDPMRCAKISAARLGQPRPPHVVEALRRANMGSKRSVESRRMMSEAHRKRGTWPPAAGKPWTRWETDLLSKLPVREVAKRTGRTESAVKSRRILLGLPDGRRKKYRRGRK